MPLVASRGGAAASGFGFGGFAGPGDFDAIATITTTADNSNNLQFTNIPQTYKHLHMRAVAVGGVQSANDGRGFWYSINLNDETEINAHWLNGALGSVGSGASSSRPIGNAMRMNTNTSNSPYGVALIDLLDYTSTTKNKTLRSYSGVVNPFSVYGQLNAVTLHSGLRVTTQPVTTITFVDTAGASFGPGSSFALYGVKG